MVARPSIPLTEVFKEYAESLQAAIRATELDMRYRLDVVAANAADAVRFAGGWMYDRVMAGWDVTVLVADRSDDRPLHILGVEMIAISNRRWRCGPSVLTRRRWPSPPICSRATAGCAKVCSARSIRA